MNEFDREALLKSVSVDHCICGYKGKSRAPRLCAQTGCEDCGWNREVYERRIAMLAKDGMSLMDNGLQALVVY